MNKKVLAVVSVVFAVLLAATAGYVLWSRNEPKALPNSSAGSSQVLSSAPEQTVSSMPPVSPSAFSDSLSSPEADALLATFGTVGKDYTLHSRYYRQGEAKIEEAPSLGWDGDLILRVNSAQIQSFAPEGSDIDRAESWNEQLKAYSFSSPCVLKLDMTLKNESAENKNGVRYLFYASMFRLAAYEDLIPENWQNSESYSSVGERFGIYESSFDKHAEGDDYYSFSLEPGETMDFTLQYLIDREYLNQQSPFLAVSPSRQIECGVLLSDLK